VRFGWDCGCWRRVGDDCFVGPVVVCACVSDELDEGFNERAGGPDSLQRFKDLKWLQLLFLEQWLDDQELLNSEDLEQYK
jgi:hypothetical protein